MKKYQSFLLIISVCLNLLIGTLLLKGINVSLAQPQTYSTITTAGIYGPAGKEIMTGDVTISAADTVLRNTLVTGNLYLTEDIAEGEVKLVNVIVEGQTVISGGGVNSITLEDTSLQNLVVNKKDSPVRIVSRGNTAIGSTLLEGPAFLLEQALTKEATGFSDIMLDTTAEVSLFGTFATFTIANEKANLSLLKNTLIEALQIDTAATIMGQGTITDLQIGSAGQVVAAGSIGTLTITGADNRLELAGGTIQTLVVSQIETSTVIRLNEKTLVENIELNGKAQISGAGQIGAITINASDTVIETESAPNKVTLAKGITALVNGKELPEKVVAAATPPKTTPPKKTKPNPAPAPEPVPPTPSPEAVKEFIVQEGISVGKKMVIVKLHAADPSTYTVTVGGERLNYMASQQSFYGEVDEGSANRSSVRVSQ